MHSACPCLITSTAATLVQSTAVISHLVYWLHRLPTGIQPLPMTPDSSFLHSGQSESFFDNINQIMSNSLVKTLVWLPISLKRKSQTLKYLRWSYIIWLHSSSCTLLQPHWFSLCCLNQPLLPLFGELLHCLYAWPTMQFPQTSVEPIILFKSLPKYCLLNDACSEPLFKVAPLPDSLKLLTPLVPFSFCLFFPKNSSWYHIPMYMLIICRLSPLQTTVKNLYQLCTQSGTQGAFNKYFWKECI